MEENNNFFKLLKSTPPPLPPFTPNLLIPYIEVLNLVVKFSKQICVHLFTSNGEILQSREILPSK
jgi:hypothetical protein